MCTYIIRVHLDISPSITALSQMLSGEQSQLSDDLSSIPSVTVGVVGLEYRAGDIVPRDYREVTCIVATPCMYMENLIATMCMVAMWCVATTC